MALDHARDFFGFTSVDPTQLDRSTPALFLTRWITHLCAPVFLFLAGVGAGISLARGTPRARLARALLIRGGWLLVLEFTIVRAGWFIGFAADITYRYAFVQVIWAIGWSMIILAALLWLPRWAAAGLAGAMIAGHHALDSVSPASVGDAAMVWRFLHVPGPFEWAPGHVLDIRYPLIPWPGVMALGFAFAPVLLDDPRRSRRACLALGGASLALFGVLRALNIYGDPAVWAPQGSLMMSALSFLNVTKYPASLQYLLLMLGLALIALPYMERLPAPVRAPLATFGGVPMFFYIAHLYVLQFGGLIFALARYGSDVFTWTTSPPESYYIGLAPVYMGWIAALLVLYRPCRWFHRIKRERPAPWHWMV